mmetsp:Transcript_18126/g.34394  ORF Transcript_18126/g.34394 Transcript_18126/m.34394 type:complete len:530 (+) Transcript_18126:136-1725(+)
MNSSALTVSTTGSSSSTWDDDHDHGSSSSEAEEEDLVVQSLNLERVEKQSLLKVTEYDDKDNDNDDDVKDAHEKSSSTTSLTSYYTGLLFLMANIAAWYTTNATNGIAMQKFSQRLLSLEYSDDDGGDGGDDIDHADILEHDSHEHSWLAVTGVTLIITTLQLLVGAMLGALLLQATLSYDRQNKQGLTIYHLFQESVQKPTFTIEANLSILHALGSSFTNLGFLWGKASLVQIIKLLEPFETLVWSHLLLPRTTKESSQALRVGVVSGMSVVVGAALSLLHMNHHAPTQIQAVIFATLSGLTLSLRNVLTRKVHHAHKDLETAKKRLDRHDSNMTTISTISSTSSTTTTTTTNTGHDELTQFEKSLWQFTQLSLLSGKSLAILTAVTWAVLYCGLDITVTHDQLWGNLLHDPALLLWHALYNIFSYVVLGSTSALTHSLLNAGKRVYSILLAILVFHEPLQLDTWLGLLMVGLGGIWYTIENKAPPNKSGSDRGTFWDKCSKPSFALCLLIILYSIRFWERSHQTIEP